MNKFKKLFILILTLTVLVTSFAVVALATDETDNAEQKLSAVLGYYDFNTAELGSLDYEANDDGKGTFIVRNTDGYADQYIEHYISSGTGNTSYLSGPYQANKLYSFTEYPYCVMDFDIMKMSGDYAGAGFNYIFYGNGPVLDETGKVEKNLNNEQVSSYTINLATFKSFLPKDYYEWAHVTAIIKYNDGIPKDYVSAYVYVDGELVYSADEFDAVPEKYDPSLYFHGTFRVNNSGDVDTTNHSGYDNWKISFFNDAYTPDEISEFTYNEEYEKPFSKTRATVGYQIFDDVSRAVEYAENGQIVALAANIANPVVVNKAVMIDTNAYDENGVPTGERYSFDYTGDGRYIPNGIIAEDEDGVIEFLKRNNASVKVYWDECSTCLSECTEHPSEACGCTCGSLVPGHLMYTETNATIFSVPVFPGKTPTFEINEDGSTKAFLGWSYTKDGEVEDIKAITPEDAERGYVDLYAIYEESQYAFAIVTSSGAVSYYMAEDAATVFSSAPKGSTVKLLSDVTVTETILLSKGITVDLNGFKFVRLGATYTDYAAEGEEGAYTKGESLGTTQVGAAGYFFSLEKGIGSITFTSTRPGAEIINVKVTADRLIKDGEVVASENVATSGQALFNHYGNVVNLNILGENITFYVSKFIYSEHGSNKGSVYNIDGGTFIQNGSARFLDILRKGEHSVKNATFISTNGTIAGTGSYDEGVIITFDNCDFVGGGIGLGGASDAYIFNNCRIASSLSSRVNCMTMGVGTLMMKDATASGAKLGTNGVVIPETSTVSYNTYTGSFDVVTGEFTLSATAAEKTFTHKVADATTMQYTTVIWDPACDVECDCHAGAGGHVLTTETIVPLGYVPSYSATIPQFATTADGIGVQFLGWSYTKGGEVDDLTAVTEADVENKTLKLYPVYETIQYHFELITSAGVSSWYLDTDFTNCVAAAKNGATIKLHSDAIVTASATVGINLTLDLNGYTLYKQDVGTGSVLFNIKHSSGARTFTITSSRPGAQIIQTLSVISDTGATVTTGNLLIAYQGAPNHTLNINGGVTIYCSMLWQNQWGTNVNNCKYNLEGSTFYCVSKGPFIRNDIGGDLNFKDCTFYMNGNAFFNDYTDNANNKATRVNNLFFDNCDILNCKSFQFSCYGDNVTFNNTRLYGTAGDAKFTIGAGTMGTSENTWTNGSLVAEGCEKVVISETRTYNVLVDKNVAYDPETGLPTYEFATTEITVTYIWQVTESEATETPAE